MEHITIRCHFRGLHSEGIQQPETQQVLDRIVRDWHGSGWLLEEGRKYQIAASPMVIELRERYRNDPRLNIPVTP
jgi:polar amino acid transport system substrate-binding protein